MSQLIGSTFRLVVEDAQSAHDARRDKFMRAGGADAVSELLRGAGYTTGTWQFRIFESFRCTGRTPPIQVRRPDRHGVIIRCKPGSNDSGVCGTLMVGRDKSPLSPEVVYHRLADHLSARACQGGLAGARDHDEPVADLVEIDDETTRLILLSVGGLEGQHVYARPEDYAGHVAAGHVAAEVSPGKGNPATWIARLESLTDRGLLSQSGAGYRLTADGRAMVGMVGSASAEANGRHAPAVAAVPDEDALVKLLIANRQRLEDLMALPTRLEECRKSQRDIAAKIAAVTVQIDGLTKQANELYRQLEDAKAAEARMVKGYDPGALVKLLGVA